MAGHRWARTDTTVKCDDEDIGDHVTVDRDSTGTIRRLRWSGGTEDHAETHSYYYDAVGRLRFAFLTLGAVNGTQREERVYYAGTGEVVRRLLHFVEREIHHFKLSVGNNNAVYAGIAGRGDHGQDLGG